MIGLTTRLAAAAGGVLILAACQTANAPRQLATPPRQLADTPIQPEKTPHQLAGASLARPDRQEAELRDSLRASGASITRQRHGFLLDVPQELMFSFDSAELRPQAREIVRSLVVNVLRFETMRVGVYGFTDTAGSEAYNRRLSQARADSVARELARDGFDRARIITYGFGEENLRVKTPDGVREPANRRVEIFLEPVTG